MAAETTMLHVRINEKLKGEAAETLAGYLITAAGGSRWDTSSRGVFPCRG